MTVGDDIFADLWFIQIQIKDKPCGDNGSLVLGPGC
jgi:hypothetical protein